MKVDRMTEPAGEDHGALEALLAWYVAMGVTSAVEESPRDHFAQPIAVRGGEPVPAGSPERAASPSGLGSSSEGLIAEARASAAAATSVADLTARWAALPGCGLAATASSMIVAGGTAGARIMIVAGAPDSDDERRGAAFCGAKGQLLDAMLRAIGLDRSGVYLAHVVPWRPPGNRAPTPLELALCLPFARRHIALAEPAILVCLGERAAQPLLDSRDPISRLRGRWISFEGDARTVKTTVTFSLDYLLKQPLQKRKAWVDLQAIAAAL